MSNKPSTTQVYKRGQQAAFEGRDKDNPYKDDITLGRVWKKGYEQFLINRNELFDFTERFNYPKAKMSRPHILLKNGDVLRFCFLNAGQFVGYDGNDQRQSAEIEDVAAIQYNDYKTYNRWQHGEETLTKLDEIPKYREYSAWCHDCSRPFIYYFTGMDDPDYKCPYCNSNEHVTVP